MDANIGPKYVITGVTEFLRPCFIKTRSGFKPLDLAVLIKSWPITSKVDDLTSLVIYAVGYKLAAITGKTYGPMPSAPTGLVGTTCKLTAKIYKRIKAVTKLGIATLAVVITMIALSKNLFW